MMFDNEYGTGANSRMLVVEYEEDATAATLVWEVRARRRVCARDDGALESSFHLKAKFTCVRTSAPITSF